MTSPFTLDLHHVWRKRAMSNLPPCQADTPAAITLRDPPPMPGTAHPCQDEPRPSINSPRRKHGLCLLRGRELHNLPVRRGARLNPTHSPQSAVERWLGLLSLPRWPPSTRCHIGQDARIFRDFSCRTAVYAGLARIARHFRSIGCETTSGRTFPQM